MSAKLEKSFYALVIIAIAIFGEWNDQQHEKVGRAAIERAEYWQRQAETWRAFASAYQCPAVTSKCRVDGCVNVCTGEPSIEARP